MTAANASRAVVLGTMNFGRLTPSEEARALLVEAHETGIGVINTADTDYSGASELVVGEHLRSLPPSDHPRIMVELSGRDMGVPDDPNLTPTYLRTACERSLARLGVDRVDRVVLPRPSWRIPIEETLAGVHELVVQPGLAASVGVSTFPAWLTCHGQHSCLARHLPPIASELAPFNLLDRRVENELLPNARFWNMEFYAWAALGQGLLAGRYLTHGDEFPAGSRAAKLGGLYAERVNPTGRQVAAEFVSMARDFGYEPVEAAVSWCLTQPGVTGAVIGPRSVGQVRAVAQAPDLRLDAEFLHRVDDLVPPGSAVTDFFNSAPWMLEQI